MQKNALVLRYVLKEFRDNSHDAYNLLSEFQEKNGKKIRAKY